MQYFIYLLEAVYKLLIAEWSNPDYKKVLKNSLQARYNQNIMNWRIGRKIVVLELKIIDFLLYISVSAFG